MNFDLNKVSSTNHTAFASATHPSNALQVIASGGVRKQGVSGPLDASRVAGGLGVVGGRGPAGRKVRLVYDKYGDTYGNISMHASQHPDEYYGATVAQGGGASTPTTTR